MELSDRDHAEDQSTHGRTPPTREIASVSADHSDPDDDSPEQQQSLSASDRQLLENHFLLGSLLETATLLREAESLRRKHQASVRAKQPKSLTRAELDTLRDSISTLSEHVNRVQARVSGQEPSPSSARTK